MRKIGIILLLFIISSSCSTSYYVNKAKDKCPECFKQDTTITNKVIRSDTIIRLDTSFFVKVKTDTIEKKINIKNNLDTITEKKDGMNLKIWINDGILGYKFWFDDNIEVQLNKEIKIKDAKITKLRTININKGITINEQKSKLEKAFLFIRYGLIILGLLSFLWFIFRLIK
ncbi:MAG: hypothetical protein PF487_00980 [Bacteroidales bacterium]|jgi:hypothetical protein|nr:hypothetical protein [Bacteroidales bacterium]